MKNTFSDLSTAIELEFGELEVMSLDLYYGIVLLVLCIPFLLRQHPSKYITPAGVLRIGCRRAMMEAGTPVRRGEMLVIIPGGSTGDGK